MPRNPPWARDELIIALDLYLRHGQLGDHDPEVLRVSGVLNGLPIHTIRPDEGKFRNGAGVSLKLANFAALDPTYDGAGMRRGGQGDAAVWDELHDNPALVHSLATAIQEGAAAAPDAAALPDDLEDGVQEGRILYRLHRSRERNRAVVARKKASVLKAGHALSCEACGFIFRATYGALGGDYIEVHHRVPLHVSGPTETRLTDLSLVCANCHRMIHQSRPWLTVENLAALVKASRS